MKSLEQLISEAAREVDADVVVLAECRDLGAVLRALNESVPWKYNFHPSPASRVAVFSRYPSERVHPLSDISGLSFRHIYVPIGVDVLLVCAHLPSKLHSSDSGQAMSTSALRQEIIRLEGVLGHKRTLVLGDLNMNPFELGLVDAHGFHAVSSKAIASRGSRKIKGAEYAFFYNPMWSLLGDTKASPPGTYYRDATDSFSYYWHMFDQVLVRPDLVSRFAEDTLKIVTSIKETQLLRANGRINSTIGSDHLPITFEVDLREA